MSATPAVSAQTQENPRVLFGNRKGRETLPVGMLLRLCHADGSLSRTAQSAGRSASPFSIYCTLLYDKGQARQPVDVKLCHGCFLYVHKWRLDVTSLRVCVHMQTAANVCNRCSRDGEGKNQLQNQLWFWAQLDQPCSPSRARRVLCSLELFLILHISQLIYF